MDYQLQQTGEQLQTILNDAPVTKQGLADEITRAEGIEGGLRTDVDANESAIGTINGKIPEAATADNKLTDKAYVDNALSAETTRAEGIEGGLRTDVDANEAAIGTINGKIPSEASPSNQLADKAFLAAVNDGYHYIGIATADTNPGTPTSKVFYIAKAAGTYTNFGAAVITQGITILKYDGNAWTAEQVYGVDDNPTPGSDSLVRSSGVASHIVYDISEANGGATYADLAAALDGGNNIPESIRHGGMRIQFIKGTVQSSDNKYIQARLMADSWTTDVTQWQVVEDTPQENSKNIISSGGVFNNLLNIGIENADAITPSMTNTGGITMDGTISGNTYYRYSEPISVAAGNILAVKTIGATSLASIAVKLDGDYYPHAACMGNNPSYQFYIAKEDTNIVITCSAEALSSLVVKKFKNEVVNEISKNYSSIILNTLSTLYTDSRILKWGDIPAIEGFFEVTSFAFQHSTYGTHKVFPVNGGDKVYIDNDDGGRTYYGFVKTYTPPFLTHNLTIDYATGCSRVIVNSANPRQTVTVPDDAHYMIVCNTFNDRVWAPTALTINDYDVFTGIVKTVVDTKKEVEKIKYSEYLSYELLPILSGALDTYGLIRTNTEPILNGHKELPVKAGQLIKIYPCSDRVGFAVVKKINSDGTFDFATGYSSVVSRSYATGPIEFNVPFDAKLIVISEYNTPSSTTYHWYAEDILVDGCSIVNSQKDDNIIWKNFFIENMLLGGAPITPTDFSMTCPSGGDTLEDGSVCVGYYGGLYGVWSEATSASHPYDTFAGLTIFNMLNPIRTQESYKALKDGDVVMWNQTNGQPNPEGESAIWRGEGIGRLGQTTDTCAKFINDNTIRVLTNAGNCLCYVDFNRTAKTFEQVTGVYKFSGIHITIPKPAEGEQVVIPIYAGDTYNFRDVADPSVNYLTVVSKQFALADETTTTLTFVGDIYFNVPDGVAVPEDGILDKVSGTGEDALSYSSESIYNAHIGHMILLKIGDSYFNTDITTSYVENIENAISAIDSNFTSYLRQLSWDGNPVRLGGFYWLNVNVSRCQCLFKSSDLKVFEFVRVIPSGHSSPECEFAPLGNYLYGIVRGWKNADADNGGYSQLFKYDVVNDTFSDFVELEGLCGERPAFAIVDNKIYTINRVGNTVYDDSTIQRGNKLFQVYDLDFNLLNTVPLNFRRGCNTIQFIVHAKNLYAFVPGDSRGLVINETGEGRSDLVWTYIDVRYLNK